jgi:predicted  nucleic acid-binding Zn-ribbon protein
VRHEAPKKLSLENELKSSEELINFLETKLEQHEKNLGQKKQEYEALQTEYYQLQDKFSQSRHKYKRAALILTDFLEDIVSKQPGILSGD